MISKVMRNFHFPGRSPVYSRNGMVATSHPIAAHTALQTLEKGGNAVDAAIAAALVLPICEPQMTGLYGDMFALIKHPDSQEIIGLNGSGKSPSGLTANLVRSQGQTKIMPSSPHSITLPGAIAAFERLANDYSQLGLTEACKPAIYYAEQGVPVTPRVAFDWRKGANNLLNHARTHYLLNGVPPKPGQVFRAPLQSKVLQKISKYGSKGFYDGDVANDIINSLTNIGGLHTIDDLNNVTCEYVDPISTNYKGLKLIELPPNGQGATALLLAKILSNFDYSELDPIGYERVHLETEATKLAYRARNRFIADPNFLTTNISTFLDDQSSSNMASLINLKTASPNLESQTEEVHLDTVLVTVVDRNRCAISLIFSIFHSFGSGHASEKYGLIFQNRGSGFTLEKNHPNELAGDKRPLHTIIPAMITKNDELMLVYGVMGGQYQPAGHVRILSNIVDFGQDIQTAIDNPRSFPDSSGLLLELGYDQKIFDHLKFMGHQVMRPDSPLGGAQGIVIDNKLGILIGGSDPRKDGMAIGY